jgi:hypothetical protein
MHSSPAGVKLQLTVDLAAHSDAGTIKAMTEVFPEDIRPSISVVVHLTESSVGGAAYIVLTILGGGLAWLANKVLGPSFDEIGNRLRDAVKAYFDRRKRIPPGVGLQLTLQSVEVRISIDTRSLLSWKDDEQHFRMLAQYITDGFGEVTSRNAERVRLRWGPELNRWVFCDIWTKDMISSYEYYVFDIRSGKWIKKHL